MIPWIRWFANYANSNSTQLKLKKINYLIQLIGSRKTKCDVELGWVRSMGCMHNLN